MKKYLIAVLALSTLLGGSAALADHRPGNVVVMGGTLSLTGRLSVASGLMLEGRKIYVEELNARGGLLGHKVSERQSSTRPALVRG